MIFLCVFGVVYTQVEMFLMLHWVFDVTSIPTVVRLTACPVWIVYTQRNIKNIIWTAFQSNVFVRNYTVYTHAGKSLNPFSIWYFFCVLVLCTQVHGYDVCGVTLSVHPHRASWKVCLTTGTVHGPPWSGKLFRLSVWMHTQSITP
jgi:hypothetical protein